MSERIVVGTDGSSKPNPGPGSWAVVAEDGSGSTGARSQTTNNVMELVAIREALLDYGLEGPVLVKSDSQLSINVITGVWKAKANLELIEEVRGILTRCPDAKFQWVKGHDPRNREPLNTAADALCERTREAFIKNGPLDPDGDDEMYAEFLSGEIDIDREVRAAGPSGKKISVAKFAKKNAMTSPKVYALLRRLGHVIDSTAPSPEALSSGFAHNTGKTYSDRPYFVWDEGFLESILEAQEAA